MFFVRQTRYSIQTTPQKRSCLYVPNFICLLKNFYFEPKQTATQEPDVPPIQSDSCPFLRLPKLQYAPP